MSPSTIEQRVDRLEREVRRWRFLAAAFGFALLVGAGALGSRAAWASDAPSRKLTLVSADKRHKLELDPSALTISQDGETLVALTGDSASKVRLALSAPHAGVANARRVRVELSAGEAQSTLTLNPPTEAQEPTTLSAP